MTEIILPKKVKRGWHYPPLIDEQVKKILRTCADEGERDLALERIARMMQRPLFQYRPVPQALAFHKCPKRFRFCLGGNRCLSGSQLIESPDGLRRCVSDIEGPHEVWAWDGEKKVRAKAEAPYIKGVEEMYRVTFSNGESLSCTRNHRVLTDQGWLSLDAYAHAHGYVLCDLGIASNSQSGCSKDSRPCDARPLHESDSGQSSPPSQADAQVRHRGVHKTDGLARIASHNRLPSQTSRLSSRDVDRLPWECGEEPLSRSSCTRGLSGNGSNPTPSRSTDTLSLEESIPEFAQPATLSPQTRSSFRSCCLTNRKTCGEPLPHQREDGQCASPSQAETLGHTHQRLADGLAHEPEGFVPSSFSLSIEDEGFLSSDLQEGDQSRSLGMSYEQSPSTCENAPQCRPSAAHRTASCESDLAATSSVLVPRLISENGCEISISCIVSIGMQLVYDFGVKTHKNYFAGGVINSNSSKSHAGVVETIMFATGTHPFRKVETPNRIWSCAPTFDMIGGITWKKMEPLLQGFDYHVTWMNRPKGIPDRVKIVVPGGESEIVFKSYEQRREAFQGTDMRAIHCDEQLAEDLYLEMISRIGAAQQLDFFCTFTPIIPQPWLQDKLSNLPPHFGSFEFPLDDNRISCGGFIRDEDIQLVIDEWPEEMQATRRLGKWASFIGAVYKTFNRDAHVVTPDVEISEKYLVNGKVPNTSFCFGSIDWGGNNPFVFLLGYKVPHLDNEWYIFDEYYWDYRKKGERLIRDHAAEIKRRVKSYETSLHATYADHDVQDRAEMAASGVGTHPAAKEVLVGIEFVQSLLKVRGETGRPRLHIASRCEQTIKQMSSLRWPDATVNRDPQDVPVKKDDHAADALRYLCYSENKSAAPKKIVKPWSEPRKF